MFGNVLFLAGLIFELRFIRGAYSFSNFVLPQKRNWTLTGCKEPLSSGTESIAVCFLVRVLVGVGAVGQLSYPPKRNRPLVSHDKTDVLY